MTRNTSGSGPEPEPSSPVLPWWLAPLLVAICYGPALGRGFTSEDFLLLRYLGEHPSWERGQDLFRSSWLGIDVVRFYRPLAEWLLSLERWFFGVASSIRYEVTHLALHLCNIALVAGLARRLLAAPAPAPPARSAALWAALIFGLYPYHPNAVLWVASYANLFGNTAALLALWLWVRFRSGGRPLNAIGSLVAFVAGLLCYEGVLVIAAIVPLIEVLCLGRTWRSLLVTIPAWLTPSLAYLAVRTSAVGELVGGYPSWTQMLDSTGTAARSALQSLAALPYPDTRSILAADVAILLLLWVLPAGIGLWICWHRRDPIAGTVALAPLWVLLGISPFAFRVVHPGEGRYWYLATVGMALLGAALVSAAGRRGRRQGALAAFAVLVLVGSWLPSLFGHLAMLRIAGTEAERVRATLSERVRPGERAFVTGYPLFVTDRFDRNVAQVYHYGLRDALSLPFSPSDRDIYPLPPPEQVDPSAALGHGRVLRYDTAAASSFAPVSPPRAVSSELVLVEPANGGWLERDRPTVRIAPLSPKTPALGDVTRMRIVLVTPGNASVAVHPAREGYLELPLAREMLATFDWLYRKPDGAPVWNFVWVEALNDQGEPVARSSMHSFRLHTRRTDAPESP